jgi:hypothetical protein
MRGSSASRPATRTCSRAGPRVSPHRHDSQSAQERQPEGTQPSRRSNSANRHSQRQVAAWMCADSSVISRSSVDSSRSLGANIRSYGRRALGRNRRRDRNNNNRCFRGNASASRPRMPARAGAARVACGERRPPTPSCENGRAPRRRPRRRRQTPVVARTHHTGLTARARRCAYHPSERTDRGLSAHDPMPMSAT